MKKSKNTTAVDSIYSNLIEYAIIHGDIDKAKLAKLVCEMDGEIAVRFANALLDLVNPDEIERDIPEDGSVYNHENCRKIGYNYMTDRVKFEYDEPVTLFFKTEKEADEFLISGRNRWNGKDKSSEEYPFCATHTYVYEDDCPRTSWCEE